MSQTPTEIRRLLSEAGVSARKAYGQHFLADSNLISKVVALAGIRSGDRVLEVGAGTGALTRALVTAGASVLAYEVDERLAPILSETLQGIEVDLRFEDVMKATLPIEEQGWKLVANLPYNIGTPLVLELLRNEPHIQSMTVMVQREVAERLVATAGSSAYGLPSVVVGLTADPAEGFTVPPQVFVPPPRVESMVIRLDRRDVRPAGLDRALDLARTAFGQRRKMLRRTLSKVGEEAFAAAGIDPTARPEQLSPADFLRLAEAHDG